MGYTLAKVMANILGFFMALTPLAYRTIKKRAAQSAAHDIMRENSSKTRP
jgi:cbb3-type cytochrome oxidase subunit 3